MEISSPDLTYHPLPPQTQRIIDRWRKLATVLPSCRACGQRNLQSVLNLGNVPLSNAFLDTPAAPEERYPLELAFCPHCALVQITETIDPEKLFSNYLYFSSVSQTMLDHARDMAQTLIRERNLNDKSIVLELASNDGYLLQYFAEAGIRVMGVDPAQNIAAQANAKGIPTLCAFFGDELARTLPKADVVIANNVLGHVADLNGFVSGIKRVLKPNGVAVIEVPYVRDMIERNEFDTIYHEHLCYFSVTALVNLFKRNGLQVIDAERIDIHGGSLRITASHLDALHPSAMSDNPANVSFKGLMQEERELGIDRVEYYKEFAEDVERLKAYAWETLNPLKMADKQIIGYGAAAKGAMFLNVMGFTRGTIDYVVDATPAKQGKFMAGSRIPVKSPAEFGNPDYCVILAWNWADEIKAKHPDYKGEWLVLR